MLNAAHRRLVVPTANLQDQPIFLQYLREFERAQRQGIHPAWWHVRCYVPHDHQEAAMNHIHTAALVTTLRTALFLAASAMASEGRAFPVAPATLSYAASMTSPTPPSQTVTFSKKSLVPRPWTASGDMAWIAISPPSGTISREQDQIVVQVNATGMATGTYSGTVRIAIADKNDRIQVTAVPVTLTVTGGSATATATATVTPSILLNPMGLSFSGVAGGPSPLAKPITVSNPTGGTLTWTLTETAAWLGLNITSGTTTTETDSVSASVSTTGLAAGSYSTVITMTASGSSNSPQAIPVTLTLTPPTTTGTATLTWDANTETDVTGYNVYMGTQSGLYGPPMSVGNTTSYTVGNLTGGRTYYFSLTAVDSAGNESQPSSEVSKSVY
jgi:hypothetical protein